jgi:hypothetical protein
MGGRAIDPRKYQQPVEINARYARSVARAAMVKIKKYRCPYAVLRYGLEYIIRRITPQYKDHLPSHWDDLPWYELVGIYDQRTDIDVIIEDILAVHQGDYPSASGIRNPPGSKSK